MMQVYSESQIVDRVDFSKAIGTSWLFVPVNIVEGLRLCRGRSLPRRAISQTSLDEVCGARHKRCVSAKKYIEGDLGPTCVIGIDKSHDIIGHH